MGNEYGVSPLTVLELLGPMMVIVPLLLWVLVIGPAIIYPLARWRANRDGVADPQLGLKVTLHYFRMLAFHVLLLGALVIVWTVISKGSGKGSMYRSGLAFLIAGGGLFAGHIALLARTNDALFAGVRRLFLGYNLVVTGLIAFAAIVLAFQALFAKGSSGDTGRGYYAALLVYGAAWAGCGFQFARIVLGDGSAPPPAREPVASEPATHVPPTPGLPSLSQGAYPPIDPKA